MPRRNHQGLLNCMGTPQYRTNDSLLEEQKITVSEPLYLGITENAGNKGNLYGYTGQVDQSGHQKPYNLSEDEKLSIEYKGFARAIRTNTKNKLRAPMKEQTSKSLSRCENKLGCSTDLFYFEIPEDRRDLVERLSPW
mmetsp:Transcript_2840/g.4145  ORF Transcript_2840/g.4145 Transcript_2840/m.4145 type:complete len:138 (+) Transcript_2840:190-603(+)